MEESKKWWQSRTFWAAAACVVAGQIPPVAAWAAANPEACSAILGLVFGGLRIATTKPVTLGPKKEF